MSIPEHWQAFSAWEQDTEGLICMIRAAQANRLTGQRKYRDSTGNDVSGYPLRPLFHSKDREIKGERGDEEGTSK